MAGPTDPRHSGRFKKGRTGNPNGRPRKVRPAEASAFQILVDRTLTVTQNGVPREMTVDDALQQRTLEAAIAGSRMAERTILKRITKREKARAAKFAGPRTQVTLRVEPEDPKNADATLQILGIAKRKELGVGVGVGWENDRDYLLLEPWAVQAALTRRRGGQGLNKREKDEVRRCTREL